LRLTTADVNLNEGILVIHQSKFNNSRLVPMSDSLFKYFRDYCHNMKFAFNSEKPVCLFPVARGKPYGSRGIYGRFRYFLDRAGIAYGGRGHGPRLHDARHTFAVHALEQMVKNGLDIYCALPILSSYMGHRTIESTEQYVRLVPSAHMNIINALEPMYEGLFPEVVTYE
jgi:integrase